MKITTNYNQDFIVSLKSLTEVFIEQIELYSDERIGELVQKILEIITVRPTGKDRTYEGLVDVCLAFVRDIYEYKRWESKALLKIKRGNCKVGRLYVLVNMRRVFSFNDDIVLEVLTGHGIIDELLEVSVETDLLVWQTVLEVLTEFATVLVKSVREVTLL